ncbi:MAG: peptidase [Gemmatimonadota bacterium]|nr:MAG: peptidase [Gemmatimonadota bacterium]
MNHSEDVSNRAAAMLAAAPVEAGAGAVIGRSREGRPIHAFHLGRGHQRVSLLGGCHADEPVGPRLLRHLCAYLAELPDDDPLIEGYDWWIVPHINPDGAARNRAWQAPGAEAYDLVEYLSHAVRELPGDDIEFGFPPAGDDDGARPENRAVYDWWRSSETPFTLHVSLHGMAFAAGPWFLIEAAWTDRCGMLMQRCVSLVAKLGYELHDVERRGEKGFFRIAKGFCTRPDSRYMRQYFESLGDEATAALFRPSSMETIRSRGGDPLTLVSEMPLFITPGVGATLGPPDPVAEEWKRRIEEWRAMVADAEGGEVARAARRAGLRPMPVRDQMVLQWGFISAGLAQTKRALD